MALHAATIQMNEGQQSQRTIKARKRMPQFHSQQMPAIAGGHVLGVTPDRAHAAEIELLGARQRVARVLSGVLQGQFGRLGQRQCRSGSQRHTGELVVGVIRRQVDRVPDRAEQPQTTRQRRFDEVLAVSGASCMDPGHTQHAAAPGLQIDAADVTLYPRLGQADIERMPGLRRQRQHPLPAQLQRLRIAAEAQAGEGAV